MREVVKGVGKCVNDHPGSYGYPTRPEEAYGYCPKCGQEVVWACANCGATLPEDPEELAEARFCRQCGVAYFGDEPVLDSEREAASESVAVLDQEAASDQVEASEREAARGE